MSCYGVCKIPTLLNWQTLLTHRDEVEVNVTKQVTGRLLVVKFLRPRSGSSETIGVVGLNFYGYSQAMSFNFQVSFLSLFILLCASSWPSYLPYVLSLRPGMEQQALRIFWVFRTISANMTMTTTMVFYLVFNVEPNDPFTWQSCNLHVTL